MEERNYLDVINNSFLPTFSEAYIIDTLADKVYNYSIANNQINQKQSISFMNFIDEINKFIEERDVSGFINSISLQKLEESKRDGNDKIVYKYHKKLNVNLVESYISIIQLVEVNNTKLVLILSTKAEEINFDKNVVNQSNDSLELKLKNMSDDVSDSILKIFNAVDAEQNNYVNNYVRIVLEQLIKNFPEFNSSLEKNLISQVNKKNNVIMIVDDDSMTRNLLKKSFEDEYVIVEAENGKVAIDYLIENLNNKNLESSNNISGIFLDISMPVLDGFAVLDFLKQGNLLSKLPVIIVSAAEDRETRKKAYQYSIADMLEKPFNLEIIKHRTKNFIELYKTSKSLNDLVMHKNKELIMIIDQLVKSLASNYSRIREYINIFLTQMMADNNLNATNNTVIFLQVAMLSVEYNNLLEQGTNHYDISNTIINKENIKYNSAIINTFKKILDKFMSVR